MVNFLLWIGLYNVLGPIVLVAMHDERIADAILRRGTEIVSESYSHGPFGRLWLWWSATVNAFLGAIMVLATRWPSAVQREVCLAVLAVYVVMYIVCAIGARRRPPWGRGALAIHFLWPAQLIWGAWALWG